ncbi:acid protease [Panus rudis PR-1116 ss-1]|nr:acid protease [Panus rudis PR-1116 ss-1]
MYGLSLLLLVSSIIRPVFCITYPLKQRSSPPSVLSSLDDIDSDPYSFANHGNNYYSVTLLVGEEEFEVALDTGSYDLWLDLTNRTLPPDFNHTGEVVSLAYVEGTGISGEVLIGEVVLGEFGYPLQAFINGTGTSTHDGYVQGILGLGPAISSHIYQDAYYASGENSNLEAQYAYPLIENIFQNHPDLPRFITFLFSHSTEIETVDGGTVIEEFADITSSPRLLLNPEAGLWATKVEGITLNGRTLFAAPTPQEGFQALVDTGSTLTEFPPEYVDAIYKDIPSASFFPPANSYAIPCDTKLNVTISVAGVKCPIHPFDLVKPIFLDDNGNPFCVGGIKYGGDESPAYIQFRSITDADQAWAEFDSMNEARLKDFTKSFKSRGRDEDIVVGALSTNKDDDSSSSESTNVDGLIQKSYIIIGMLGALIALLIGLIIAIVIVGLKARKKAKKERKATYQGLSAPAPAGYDDQQPFTETYSEQKDAEYTNPYADAEESELPNPHKLRVA